MEGWRTAAGMAAILAQAFATGSKAETLLSAPEPVVPPATYSLPPATALPTSERAKVRTDFASQGISKLRRRPVAAKPGGGVGLRLSKAVPAGKLPASAMEAAEAAA